jgi:hypothetical protein
MPKGIDPKAYAARITRAKKIVAAIDPGTKAKLKEMYPDIKKEAIVNKALNPKKSTEKMKSMPKAKITGTASSKPQVSNSMSKSKPATTSKPKAPAVSKGTKTLMPKTTKTAPAKKTPMPKVTSKPKPLTGPAAVAEIQRRTSPAGVKKAEMDAKKATNKKYPGLYKK